VGLLGLLDWLPGGNRLKGRMLLTMKKNIGFLAQPNLLAGEALVRELVDVLTPARVVDEAARLLEDPQELARQSSRLRDLYQSSLGTARRIFDRLEGPA
jgi:lipid A disaccharide synthetase